MSNEWLQKRVHQIVIKLKKKVKQFGLETLDDIPNDKFFEIRKGFIQVGVWALKNSLPILERIQKRKNFSIVIGMRPKTIFHVGHLTLMRELAWLIQQGGIPIFILGSYEAGENLSPEKREKNINKFKAIYSRFTGKELPKSTLVISDKECLKIRLLEDLISRKVILKKIFQLYGWNESISMELARVPTLTSASFLFPAIQYPHCPTLVLSDIHQLTHTEITKIAAKKLNLPPPTYSYRILLPSLENPKERMSIKNPKSVIFLNEDPLQITNKLRKSFSGGCLTLKDQLKKGGNPFNCSFFYLVEVFQSYEESTKMYKECISGNIFCQKCKQSYIPQIVEKISNLSQ